MKRSFSENYEILDNQKYYIDQGLSRERVVELKKRQTQEKINDMHINFEKGLGAFIKKMESIKSDSILKKTMEERKEIYMHKKYLEKLKKQKEDEEKLLNSKVNDRLESNNLSL